MGEQGINGVNCDKGFYSNLICAQPRVPFLHFPQNVRRAHIAFTSLQAYLSLHHHYSIPMTPLEVLGVIGGIAACVQLVLYAKRGWVRMAWL